MLPLRGRRPELLGRGTSALARRSLARLCSVSHAPSTHGAVDTRASLLHRPSCAPPAFGSGPSFSLLLHPDRSPAPPVEDVTTSLDMIMPGGLSGLTLEMPAGAEVTVEMPGVESEIAGETIQAVGKKGWRTYQPSFLRRKRKLGFMKCAAALSPPCYLGPLVCPRPAPAHTTPRPGARCVAQAELVQGGSEHPGAAQEKGALAALGDLILTTLRAFEDGNCNAGSGTVGPKWRWATSGE